MTGQVEEKIEARQIIKTLTQVYPELKYCAIGTTRF